MKRLVLIIALLWCCGRAWAAPVFVSANNCPNSLGASQGGASDYKCPLSTVSLANNLLVFGLIYDNSTSPTVTVTTIDNSGATVDTMTQVVTRTTGNANVVRIYKVATAGGAYRVKVHFSAATGFVQGNVAEFYNANTTASGTAVCNDATSASITTGNITVGSGNLLVQVAFQDDTAASGALTAGSGMTFAITDRNDSNAMQYRLGTGSAINPTITQTSHKFASCAAGFTAAVVGTAPSNTYRPLRVAHAEMPASSANPYVIQVPVAGSLAVIAYHSGGNTITGVTDSASNTWTCRSAHTNGANSSQICYAPVTTPSNTLAISVTRSAATTDATLMTFDLTGSATSSPFDADGGSLTGNQGSITGSLTTCSSCLTPAAAGEMVIGTSGWDFCTATAVSAPSGAVFQSATFTGNSLDGPQSVDQNNLWFYFVTTGTGALSMTSTMSCASTAEGNWAASIAAFKAPAAGGVRKRVTVTTD